MFTLPILKTDSQFISLPCTVSYKQMNNILLIVSESKNHARDEKLFLSSTVHAFITYKLSLRLPPVYKSHLLCSCFSHDVSCFSHVVELSQSLCAAASVLLWLVTLFLFMLFSQHYISEVFLQWWKCLHKLRTKPSHKVQNCIRILTFQSAPS